MRITVAGAGIIGLSTAYGLKMAGHNVSVIAKNFSPDITSNKAAAFWFPYHIRNDHRGIEWCRKSYNVYTEFSSDSLSGISSKKIIKAIHETTNEEDNSWLDYMPSQSFKIVEKDDLPRGYKKGYEAVVPLIETQIFLPWLMEKLGNMGVSFTKADIESLEDITDCDLIINCCGLGSKLLESDSEIYAVRGQVALLKAKNLDHIFLENEKPLYIVPRQDAIIVGGTFEENIYEEKTVQETLTTILENAYNIMPELRDQEVIGSWAGLRPYRKLVRLEKVGKVIHNYGHGGSGFTLAWGCAEDVKNLIN